MSGTLAPQAVGPVPDGGFAELVDSLRDLLDAACAAAAPDDLNATVATEVRRLSSVLRPYAVAAGNAPAGHRPDLPGEGHPLVPPTVITESSPDHVRAEITFRRAHDASGNAVHGGLLPLVYDDVLGRLAARATPSLARTAYLHVDYRAVTPIGLPLLIEGGIEHAEGRKILTWGHMTDGHTVLTTARALFVIARSG
jgi:acyl-coenzyme A thioesterase PaaI-like protein